MYFHLIWFGSYYIMINYNCKKELLVESVQSWIREPKGW